MEKTNDYSLFKIKSGNAPIKQAHIMELCEAIDKENLLEARPILINEKWEVIDGQHRLRAAEMLKVPIFYMMVPNLDLRQLAKLNSNQRNWRLDYFLDLYADHVCNPNYIKLKEWMNENDFNLNQTFAFFIHENNILKFRNSFKDGEFNFDVKCAEVAEEYKIFLNKAQNLTKGHSRPWKQQNFIRSFIMFLKNPEVKKERFFDQVEKYPFLLSARPTKKLLLEMLYEIYNYRRHIKADPNIPIQID